MKFSYKVMLLFFIALHQIVQIRASTFNVVVDDGNEASLEAGLTVGTLVKQGGGQLDVSGAGYDINYIYVEAGTVYVNDATDLYLTKTSDGSYVDQPATLLASTLYSAKLFDFTVDVSSGSSEVGGVISVPLLIKTGSGTADFSAGLTVHYLKVSEGTAIINQSGVPAFQIQLATELQASSNLDIPDVILLNDATVNNSGGYSVKIGTLSLQSFNFSTSNSSTEVDQLDATLAGGTFSNADLLTLKGAQGSFPITKKDVGTVDVTGDLSGSTIAVTTQNGVLKVSSLGKLPTASVDISTGTDGLGFATSSTFLLSSSDVAGTPTAGAVPGAMTIESGCMLEIDSGVIVPAENSASDVFTGGLTVENNTILKLSNGANWGRSIVVGSNVPHI